MAKKVLVSFVVLNWNGIEDTLVCLDSLRRQTIDDCEIIVVDNGSVEPQKNTLRAIKDIKLIDLPKNTGFTGGQLAAYEQSEGEFIALINNDAVIAKDWAEKAVQTLRKNKQAAAAGGRAYQWDESLDQKAYQTTNKFYSYQVVNLTSGHTKTLDYGNELSSVNSISGAGVLIRRKSIDKVGYFDNRFFAYYEETDLFARFKRAGLQVLYNPELSAWHKIAQSTRSNPNFYLFYMHRNRFIYAVRNFDPPYLRHFLRTYCKEFLQSVYRVLRRGKNNAIEEYNFTRAFAWNSLHLAGTLAGRHKVKKLGSAYSKKLLTDKAESVSIVIPCYNYADHVAEAINSVLDQTRPADEIIVINDGSTDNSLGVIQKYKDRVTVINQKNRGVIETKNRGLRMATGDWIIFLDADDKLHKKYIETLYAEARKRNADVVYCGMRFMGNTNGAFVSRPFTLRSLRGGNYINNSALMRRELLQRAGGYKKVMDFGYEDWELYLTLAATKAKFRYVKRPLLYYRRHETNSRDINAKENLHHAHDMIRRLHPSMFSLSHRLKDFLYALLTFHQRRTPLQLIKDIWYLTIKKIDKWGERSRLINKAMGAARLLTAGNFGTAIDKVKLNLKRLFGKVAS